MPAKSTGFVAASAGIGGKLDPVEIAVSALFPFLGVELPLGLDVTTW